VNENFVDDVALLVDGEPGFSDYAGGGFTSFNGTAWVLHQSFVLKKPY
jgi:hypothetical protein